MAKKTLPKDARERTQRPGNLASEIRLRNRLLWWGAALLAGVALSLVFAPMEWSWLVWIGLVPLTAICLRKGRNAFGIGYLFGIGHFTLCFSWLREVFYPAPLLAGAVCALFIALWAWGVQALFRNLQWPRERDLDPQAGKERPPPPPLGIGKQFAFVVCSAAMWTALEWVRSWIFTGFPWDQLGVSQWQHLAFVQLARFTGIYGLTFLIVGVNIGVYLFVRDLWQRRGDKPWRCVPWPLITFGVLVISACFIPAVPMPERDRVVRIAAIQGNLEQMRAPTSKQVEKALYTYFNLTRDAVAADRPDAVLWPETAIPLPMTDPDPFDIIYHGVPYEAKKTGDPRTIMAELLAETKTPMIIGTLEYRTAAVTPVTYDDFDSYNSIVHFGADGSRVEHYDKIHRVPFGEYTPFEKLWPKFILRWLYMGRSLTPGREHTIIRFKGLELGSNICFEDGFPEISRAAVLRGANCLLTITNDAWYNETCGSRQHLAHSVFRSVENARPMIRNGNNSDTCLILPDGSVEGALRDPNTDSPFFSGFRTYEVPVWENLPTTFYTRHGNLFAWATAFIALIGMGWCGYRHLDRKRRLLAKVELVPEASVPVTDADRDSSE